jgi:hypothetical protein
MRTRPDQYRVLAQECECVARSIIDPETKASLKQLARRWYEKAQELGDSRTTPEFAMPDQSAGL